MAGIAEISLTEAHVDLQDKIIDYNPLSFSQPVDEIPFSNKVDVSIVSHNVTESHMSHMSHRLLADLLVVVLHEGAALLVVTGSSLHALSLGGDTVVIVSKVLVQALHFLRRKQAFSEPL